MCVCVCVRVCVLAAHAELSAVTVTPRWSVAVSQSGSCAQSKENADVTSPL